MNTLSNFLNRIKQRLDLEPHEAYTSAMPSTARALWDDRTWPPRETRVLVMYPMSQPYTIWARSLDDIAISLASTGNLPATGPTERLQATCDDCGEALPDGAQHCIYCGVSL